MQAPLKRKGELGKKTTAGLAYRDIPPDWTLSPCWLTRNTYFRERNS